MIEQIKQTPKWKEFEEWFGNQNYITFFPAFLANPLEFQQGVFEKFIESQGFKIEKQLWDIPIEERRNMTKEEILNKQYKEAWFIRFVFLVNDEYKTETINPTGWDLRTKPFNSFQELLTFYFNK